MNVKDPYFQGAPVKPQRNSPVSTGPTCAKIIATHMPLPLNQFVADRLNTTCEHPRGISGQCVCLIRCYFDDVLDLPQFRTVGAAIDLWEALNTPDFVRIPNRLWTLPKVGDIFVAAPWDNTEEGRYGHTGIVLDGATLRRFKSFDSNWSTPLKANIEYHNYTRPRIVGFFRAKKAGDRPTLSRVNEALRACGDDPARSVGTLTLSKWWQNRVTADPVKFSDDYSGYTNLVNAIKWHQANHKYPHDL